MIRPAGLAACDPNNCFGYILPGHVEFPWNAGAGVAYHWGPTPWNRRIAEDFRDEKSVILAGDVLVSGPVAGGSGLEAFLGKRLQRSGKNASVSPRVGAEYGGTRYRLRFSLAGDAARQYGNTVLSLGFWH